MSQIITAFQAKPRLWQDQNKAQICIMTHWVSIVPSHQKKGKLAYFQLKNLQTNLKISVKIIFWIIWDPTFSWHKHTTCSFSSRTDRITLWHLTWRKKLGHVALLDCGPSFPATNVPRHLPALLSGCTHTGEQLFSGRSLPRAKLQAKHLMSRCGLPSSAAPSDHPNTDALVAQMQRLQPADFTWLSFPLLL